MVAAPACPAGRPQPAPEIPVRPTAQPAVVWPRPVTALAPISEFPDAVGWADGEATRLTNVRTDLYAWALQPVTDPELELPIGLPWADRRLADRLPVRPGCRAEIHRWGDWGGPDLAEELQDVSETGLRVRLWTPVRRRDRLDVTLWGPNAEWCGRGMGVVCWSVIGQPGHVLIGVRLSRRLTAQALRALTVQLTNRKRPGM